MASFTPVTICLLCPRCEHWHPWKSDLYPFGADVRLSLVLSRRLFQIVPCVSEMAVWFRLGMNQFLSKEHGTVFDLSHFHPSAQYHLCWSCNVVMLPATNSTKVPNRYRCFSYMVPDAFNASLQSCGDFAYLLTEGKHPVIQVSAKFDYD